MLMQKTYNKGQGDISVRIETEYKLNEAGAKQYVLDCINEMDSYTGDSYAVFGLIDSRCSGALFALYSLGLIDVFNFEELKQKQALSYSRFLDRLTSPVEKI